MDLFMDILMGIICVLWIYMIIKTHKLNKRVDKLIENIDKKVNKLPDIE